MDGPILKVIDHKKLKARSNSEEDFENQKTPGVLVASGLIVGEALMSIFIAHTIINVFIKHPDNKGNSTKNGTEKTLVNLLHTHY